MPEFIDPRNGERYQVVHLKDGNIWFAEDLRYASPGSQVYEGKTGRYYSTLNIHQAIPPGWNIPTPHEWHNLYEIYGELPKELNIEQDGYLQPSSTIGHNEYMLWGEDQSPYYLTGFHPQVGFLRENLWGLFIRGLAHKSLLGQGDKSHSKLLMPHRFHLQHTSQSVDCLCKVRCIRKA